MGALRSLWEKSRLKDRWDSRDARKVSYAETEEAFADSLTQLNKLKDYDPQEWTEAKKDRGRVGAAEQGGKLIAAQQKALAQPGDAVGAPTAASIKRAQAIAGEGADSAAEGAALVSAELEGLSEESEKADRDWVTSEEQRLLANIEVVRNMNKERKEEIFGLFGGATEALLT